MYFSSSSFFISDIFHALRYDNFWFHSSGLKKHAYFYLSRKSHIFSCIFEKTGVGKTGLIYSKCNKPSGLREVIHTSILRERLDKSPCLRQPSSVRFRSVYPWVRTPQLSYMYFSSSSFFISDIFHALRYDNFWFHSSG
jgi:hypothetical protein